MTSHISTFPAGFMTMNFPILEIITYDDGIYEHILRKLKPLYIIKG